MSDGQRVLDPALRRALHDLAGRHEPDPEAIWRGVQGRVQDQPAPPARRPGRPQRRPPR